jgi:1,4-dihydroxy-2-naphthoate octaprenyltransferase
VGAGLAWGDGVLHLPSAVLALIGALAIQVGTNLFNDYADFVKGADSQGRLGPARAAQQGWLSAGEIKRGAFVAFGVAALAGLYLVGRGGWPILALGIVSITAGFAYTGGPLPLAYVGLGDLFVLAFFGVAAVAGTYYVQALELTPVSVVLGLAVGAISTAILVVNNLRDRHTDRDAGKRTLAVRWGAPASRWEYTVLVVGAYALAGYVATAGYPFAALVVVTLPWAAVATVHVWKRDGAALNPVLGETARLLAVFGVALAAGVAL